MFCLMVSVVVLVELVGAVCGERVIFRRWLVSFVCGLDSFCEGVEWECWELSLLSEL